ncbi:CBS domain-containing protein [Nocardioides sp. Y6]|uniref:CBS domain-containing protein n=1 Tax=Nocardioides malaquae TaxID=2773426 RepID=A0ABR9RPZ9_9ACTN|nr:CBS domain-containing protein [Nocardioides malaquae]MBE7323583.1 CBS domain-containing protein [Nocardioides malaquae]
MRVNEVVKSKEIQQVVTIAPDATVEELIALLAQHNIGAVVVSADGSSLDGIVSERDVVRRLPQGVDVLRGPVSSIMTAAVHTCDGTESLEELARLMTDQRVRHVPVVVDGALTSVISIGDVVKSRIEELEFERDQLDQYVHAT